MKQKKQKNVLVLIMINTYYTQHTKVLITLNETFFQSQSLR